MLYEYLIPVHTHTHTITHTKYTNVSTSYTYTQHQFKLSDDNIATNHQGTNLFINFLSTLFFNPLYFSFEYRITKLNAISSQTHTHLLSYSSKKLKYILILLVEGVYDWGNSWIDINSTTKETENK